MLKPSKTLTPADYASFQVFLEESCGIVLGAGKEYLVTTRLASLLEAFNFDSYSDLIKSLLGFGHSQLKNRVIDAMTTNETFWFRDVAHFNILKSEIYPKFDNRRLRIWSAACSSGQEPYSISMNLQDYKGSQPQNRIDAEIIATDISPSILDLAKKGYYTGLSASRGVDPASIDRFFVKNGEGIQVKPEIQRRVSFREINLTQSYTSLGRFDVVFCRNVLIYFSAEMKFDIIQRISQALNPGGYLFLGSTEAPPGLKDFFTMKSALGGIVYQKK